MLALLFTRGPLNTRIFAVFLCLQSLLTGALHAAAATDGARTAEAPLASVSLDTDRVVHRLAFGSCFKTQRREDQVWDAVNSYQPDVFLFMGDTLYPDKDDDSAGLEQLREAYASLAEIHSFKRVRQNMPVLAVWDDHDYGRNDGGRDFEFKEASEKLFESRWGLAINDARRSRPGVYFSRTLGSGDQRLQLIMLDTRYFRSALTVTDKRGAKGRERYIPSTATEQSMLGEPQWAWLTAELAKPADLRLIVSSVQVLADGHGWEGWRLLPDEQARLFALLRRFGEVPTVLLSGDRHVAGFYERDIGLDQALLEFTSSALNNSIPFPARLGALGEAGPYRLGDLYGDNNFGALEIDWEAGHIDLSIRSDGGALVREIRHQFR